VRIAGIFLALALIVIVPFLIWGHGFEARFSVGGAVDWLEARGDQAWIAGVGLLIADLVLPLPSTAIISALGYLHGTWLGGLAGALGTTLSGLVGYELCRRFGRGVARRLAGTRDLARTEQWFATKGGWTVALARSLPILAEVVCCMAGLARMPRAIFVGALICGSVPFAFVFAAVGAAGRTAPTIALALSVVLPALLWPIARRVLRGVGDSSAPSEDQDE
jgi:uncharacterized membrane protein YdjX (TVP38/TMEM64 family)